jgi:TRAP-type mannitol/chloroaromatic compound transport system substrate-binding protein
VNVVGFQTGPMPTQPLGWFRNPITSVEQLRGMRYRTVGLATDLFNQLGAAVTALPGGEIVPALERGVIDGAEFNNPSSDRVLGFPDVAKNYMLQSYHQNTETFEVLWNKTRFDGMPDELKAVLRHSAEAASADMSWKQQLRYPNDLQAMVTNNAVNVQVTPRPVLDAQLRAWNTVIANLESDPFFKRVTDSQRDWCRRVSAFYLRNNASAAVAFNHFFAAR